MINIEAYNDRSYAGCYLCKHYEPVRRKYTTFGKGLCPCSLADCHKSSRFEFIDGRNERITINSQLYKGN